MVDKTVGESTETATKMTVMVKVGTGPERGCFPEIMAIIELEAQAIIDPGQDPELVQIGIEYIVISEGNTITLQETVPLAEKKGKLSNFKECSIWVMNKQYRWLPLKLDFWEHENLSGLLVIQIISTNLH